jgi:hypothetical protein
MSDYESYPRHSSEPGGSELPPAGFYERTLAHYRSVELALGILCFIMVFVVLGLIVALLG